MAVFCPHVCWAGHLENSLMKIRILYFAKSRELAEKAEETLELDPESATTVEVLNYIRKAYPNLESVLQTCVLALNHDYLAKGQVVLLKDGDEIAVIPPLSGG